MLNLDHWYITFHLLIFLPWPLLVLLKIIRPGLNNRDHLVVFLAQKFNSTIVKEKISVFPLCSWLLHLVCWLSDDKLLFKNPRINPKKGENIHVYENSTQKTQFTEGSIPKRIELEMLKILKHFSVVYRRPIKRLWKPKN